VLVRILSEGCQADVPQPMRGYASPIHPALTAPWDLRLLASRVRQLIQLVLMPVSDIQCMNAFCPCLDRPFVLVEIAESTAAAAAALSPCADAGEWHCPFVLVLVSHSCW
jgi:hypothetical protein